jgi:arginine/lysine/ornithine decarboxylase
MAGTNRDQNRAPLYEMLVHHRKSRIVPFDVPGHKQGRGIGAARFLGDACLSVDVNSSKPLDNLHIRPVSSRKRKNSRRRLWCDYAFLW